MRRGHVRARAIPAVLLAALLAGLLLGAARLDAIDGGALRLEPGKNIRVSGFVTATPRRSQGLTRLVVKDPRGKVLVESPRAPAGTGTGTGIVATGRLMRAPDWQRGGLRRQGVAMVMRSQRVRATEARRSGLTGWIDELRDHAEAALDQGMPAREASLARGFVLGEDDTINRTTVSEFQASGLAHLLAVSGQNVVLLALLMTPLLALSGVGLRWRLLAVASVIILYVPLAGAGASIQRAGVMGIAGLVATAASRPSSRLYGLMAAALVTLAINPLATTDVGWQLSFAAVVGIYLLAGPIGRRLAGGRPAGGWSSQAAEAAAITIAATLATAPLMAFHFGRIPVATLPANLLAVPAVAPAMWLGMIAVALGQVDSVLALPLNWINSFLLAYIARIAHWFGSPGWAVLDLTVGGPLKLGLIYLLLALLAGVWLGRGGGAVRGLAGRLIFPGVIVVAAVVILVVSGGSGRRQLERPPAGGARIEIFDVGQGDSILLRPDRGDPLLIDGGPPGGDLDGALDSAGVDDLSAVLLTHNHLDHYGGLFEALDDYQPETLFYDHAPAAILSAARSAGANPRRVHDGDEISFGDLSLEILWPPDSAGRPTAKDEDPNARSIVGLLGWHGFHMLLTGDAEAETAHLSPGPLDVLKVAHHGSTDAGLRGLLDMTDPGLAVISVGAGNRFGHPDRATLDTLRQAGVKTLRTDLDGTVSIVLGGSSPEVETGR